MRRRSELILQPFHAEPRPGVNARFPRNLTLTQPCSPCRPLPYTETVRITVDIPDDIVRHLAAQGRDPSRAAIEALAIDAYRTNRLSTLQLRTLLSIPSTYELDAFLKAHGVALEYSIDDFEREGDTSARLLRKRQDAREAPPQA